MEMIINFAKSLLLLFLPLAVCHDCWAPNQSCEMAGNSLINSEVEVTEEECKQLCQDTHECGAYTYFYEDNFPYHD